MKTYLKYVKRTRALISASLIALTIFSSCEKILDYTTYGVLDGTSFFKTQADATAAVSAMYTGMVSGWTGGFGAAGNFGGMSEMATDEGYCRNNPEWKLLAYTPDFGPVTQTYSSLIPYVSQITVNISKIQAMTFTNAALQAQYIAELKGLRALYGQILYNMYGPVPMRLDASVIDNPAAPPLPRPSKDSMVAQIIKDYSDAAAVLPNTFKGNDYGRISKAACLTGLMKLYMHEKRWTDAITVGTQITSMGFALTPNYYDNFSVKAKGGNSEIIFAVVCTGASSQNDSYTNRWLDHALPANFIDQNGNPLTNYGSFFAMPWPAYNKFDPTDKRLAHLLRFYPAKVNGVVTVLDAQNEIPNVGAVPVKYVPEGSENYIGSDKYGLDIPVYRYSDVLLLLAEAINQSTGPTGEAYTLINTVRTRAGLPNLTPGLTQADFLSKLQDERLFELWHEGIRRDDLIRWGLYIPAAIAKGATLDPVADAYLNLYPLPRSVVNQSNGVIKQNPGYN
jgi:hypothetical protein